MVEIHIKDLSKLEKVVLKNSLIISDQDTSSFLENLIREKKENKKIKECFELIYSFNSIYTKLEDIDIQSKLIELNPNKINGVNKIYSLCFTDKLKRFIESNLDKDKEILKVLKTRSKILNRIIEKYEI